MGFDERRLFYGGSCHEHPRTMGKRSRILANLFKRSKKPQWILDIGCGQGTYTKLLLGNSVWVLGIDIIYSNLANIPFEQENLSLTVMDAQKMGLENECIETMVAIEVLEHVASGADLINEIYRCLKPEGIFALTVPNRHFLFETHPIRIGNNLKGSRWGTGIPLLPLLPMSLRKYFATVHLYTMKSLCNILRRSGFVIQSTSWLMPGLDSLEIKIPSFPLKNSFFRAARWFLEILEKSPFRIFGSTIVVIAVKP